VEKRYSQHLELDFKIISSIALLPTSMGVPCNEHNDTLHNNTQHNGIKLARGIMLNAV
jgi:hypothetical protein